MRRTAVGYRKKKKPRPKPRPKPKAQPKADGPRHTFGVLRVPPGAVVVDDGWVNDGRRVAELFDGDRGEHDPGA